MIERCALELERACGPQNLLLRWRDFVPPNLPSECSRDYTEYHNGYCWC